jgi:hypothetical protein
VNDFPCLSGRCYSPIACGGFGYCREHNFVRTGLFRYVAYERLAEHLARAWMPVAYLGEYSVLCWHCECGEVVP